MFPIRIASRTRFVYLQYSFRTGLRDLHHNAILRARVSKTKKNANNPPSTGSSAGSLGTPIKEKRSKTKSPITENASSTAGSQGAHVEKSSPRSKSRRPVNDGSTLPSPVEAKKKHTKRSAKKETTFEDVLVSSSGDKTRMNIVSESLSDDIIKRLTPSLQKHMHCDIIDVNPGRGLFSSKLHDLLQPRTHVLMEPDAEHYSKYLQPLLQKDPSYKLMPHSGVIWKTWDKVEEDGYLPNQTRYSLEDPRLNQPNDTLLFVANLGAYPAKPFMGFNSVASLMIHQLLTAIRVHSIFQGYGLIRMLVWVMDSEKEQILPRMISHRRRTSVEAEICCEDIIEVAGGDAMASSKVRTNVRDHALDLESARRTRRRMVEANIKPDPKRTSVLERELEKEDGSKDPKSTVLRRPFVVELEDLEARYSRREFCSYVDENKKLVYLQDRKIPRGVRSTYVLTPEYTRLVYLRWRDNQQIARHDRADTARAEYESIMQILAQNQGAKTPHSNVQKQEAVTALAAWRAKVRSLPRQLEREVTVVLEEKRLFNCKPPAMFWDRRPAEPLVVSTNEFLPKREMCLLDIHPKPVWPDFQGRSQINYDYFEFILTILWTQPAQSIVQGLKSVAHGADEWIIPRCPSLTDPLRGGSLDLGLVTVRSMTHEMFLEIMTAWLEWPFKPLQSEMLARVGSQSVLEDDYSMDEVC